MTEIDTGFDSVLAGEVWVDPQPAVQTAAPEITVTVSEEPPCDPSSGPASEASASPPVENSPVTSGLTPAGVQAAKSLVKLPELSWSDLAKLAREMAMNIKEHHTILKEFKLTNAQYDFLQAHNEFFREAHANACREWHAPLSTQERIKVEAAAILEDSLLVLGARMQNKGEGLPGVVEAAKLFAKVAGVGERETGTAAPGERFTINIDLSGDKSLTVRSGGGAPPAGGSIKDLDLLPSPPGSAT